MQLFTLTKVWHFLRLGYNFTWESVGLVPCVLTMTALEQVLSRAETWQSHINRLTDYGQEALSAIHVGRTAEPVDYDSVSRL